MDNSQRDTIRQALSGQTAEPVEIILGPEDQTIHRHEDAPMTGPAPTGDDVDAGQVIDHMAQQIADLVKENAVLSVLAQARSERIGQLEQTARDH